MDSSPICADAIFADCWGPSARICLTYAALQISIKSNSEFSNRDRFYKSGGSRNSGDKKTKTKKRRGGFGFFGYFFGEAKK
jgi:hypothetical protein